MAGSSTVHLFLLCFMPLIIGGKLLVADCTEILSVDLPNGPTTPEVHGISRAVALDYNYNSNRVYWSDVSLDMINCSSLGLNIDAMYTQIVVDQSVSVPDGLAYDWIHDNLYWTDTGTDKIEVMDMVNGYPGYRHVLFDTALYEPRALVLDPRDGQGYMYWTDWGSNAKIEKAGMDGCDRQTIVSAKLFWPNGLTVDYATNKLYWIDGFLNTITTSDLNGNKVALIPLFSSLSHPFAITVLGNNLYWTDWGTRALHSANKIGGTVSTIVSSMNCPMEVRAFDISRQPSATNRCGSNNGGCSHLCLPNAAGGRRCIGGLNTDPCGSSTVTPCHSCVNNPCYGNAGAYFCHVDRPNKFIQCGPGNTCYVFDCPNPLIWDTSLNTCNWP